MARPRIDAEYWRQRAADMRKTAIQTNDPQSKETMLGIAHDYDLLACQFEYREGWTTRSAATEKARQMTVNNCATPRRRSGRAGP
jgi:hypothetical protein